MTIDPEYNVPCARCGHIKGEHKMSGCAVIVPGNHRCVCVQWSRPLTTMHSITSNLSVEDRTVQDVVHDRDEFMRVLRELLGLDEPVAIWDLKNWIIGRVRSLQSDRDRLLKNEERLMRELVQRLETDLLLAIDDELPLMSRTRIVRERIRALVRQTSSLEWFLSEVEMAVGLRPDETPTQNERMHKVIKLLAELVDRP